MENHSSKRLNLDDTWSRAQMLIDPRTGIIKRVFAIPCPPGLPRVFVYRATRNHLINASGEVIAPNVSDGMGFSVDPLRARMAAVGEIVERYCASLVAGRELYTSSYLEMSEPALDPETVSRPSAKQLQETGLSPVSKATQLAWMRGRRLTDDQPVWVPADLVLFGSWKIRESVSNGLACGSTYWQAVRSGLLELVERDAFTLTWLLRIPLPRIDISSIDDQEVLSLSEDFRRHGFEINICDATTDVGIPTFIAVILSDNPHCRVALSAASDLDPRRALLKSLEEGFGGVADLIANTSRPETEADITEMWDHARYYATGRDFHRLAFLLNSPVVSWDDARWASVNTSGDQEDVKEITRRLQRAGCTPYVVDITTPDIAEVGFTVVRAVVPELQFLHHKIPCLDCPRMWRIADELELDMSQGPNMAPHPFP